MDTVKNFLQNHKVKYFIEGFVSAFNFSIVGAFLSITSLLLSIFSLFRLFSNDGVTSIALGKEIVSAIFSALICIYGIYNGFKFAIRAKKSDAN